MSSGDKAFSDSLNRIDRSELPSFPSPTSVQPNLHLTSTNQHSSELEMSDRDFNYEEDDFMNRPTLPDSVADFIRTTADYLNEAIRNAAKGLRMQARRLTPAGQELFADSLRYRKDDLVETLTIQFERAAFNQQRLEWEEDYADSPHPLLRPTSPELSNSPLPTDDAINALAEPNQQLEVDVDFGIVAEDSVLDGSAASSPSAQEPPLGSQNGRMNENIDENGQQYHPRFQDETPRRAAGIERKSLLPRLQSRPTSRISGAASQLAPQQDQGRLSKPASPSSGQNLVQSSTSPADRVVAPSYQHIFFYSLTMAPAKSSSSINMKIKKVNKRNGTRTTPRNHPIAVVDQYQPAQNKQNEWKRSNGRLGREEKKFAAKDLKITPLANFISGKLNSKFGEMGLIVREIFSMELSYSETKDGKDAQKLFQKHKIETKDYQYRYRMLAVFQMQDGEDVLFFTMSVKEYRAHKWCTIEYLDSVPFFQNESVKKTQVYDEVLYSYFEYSRMIGFERIHIFVCAIEDDNEYFFHQRPATMKFPNQDGLMSWYKRLLSDEDRRIVGCVETQRPTNGRRPRNRTVEDFIFEISYSEFYRLAMEEQLESEEISIQNFERIIENYPADYENRLLFVYYRPQEVENVGIEELTIDHELTKPRCNWLETLEQKNLSFASIDEAKKSTAAILEMLSSGN